MRNPYRTYWDGENGITPATSEFVMMTEFGEFDVHGASMPS